jgi:hypothetical protein
LPAEQHGAVISAYRLAIGSSFALGGFVMLLAFLLLIKLPDITRAEAA